MSTQSPIPIRQSAYWRVVLALAGKDIVDALKNKTTLTMILGLAMMMLSVEALPLLLKLDSRPRLAIYDAARTPTADALRQAGSVQVSELRTADDVARVAREASSPLLAVALPAGWDASADALVLTGYHAAALRPQAVQALVASGEGALTAVTNRPVTIQPAPVYPTMTSGGHTIMVALGLVLAITLITTILVPYLIVEEKTAHTLDMLRVSPASMTQILLGKGIAGMVYGLLAAAVLLAFNLPLINQWGVLLLAVVTTVLFGVVLGLLVGTLVENEGAVQMWVALVAMALMVPLVATFFGSERLPEWLLAVLRWLPSVAAFDLVRLSFTQGWQGGLMVGRLTAVLAAAALAFAAAVWRLRSWQA